VVGGLSLSWIERQSTGTGGVHKWVGVSGFAERLVRIMEEKKQLEVGIWSCFVVGNEPAEACAYSRYNGDKVHVV
jgi:hypothetical protein